jgi:hypothetical protein
VDIVGLEALLAKATKGPWLHVPITSGPFSDVCADAIHPHRGAEPVADDIRKAEDAALIIAAVNALPHLLAEITRLRAVEAALADLLPTPLCGESWDLPDSETVAITITFGKLRAARNSLPPLIEGQG